MSTCGECKGFTKEQIYIGLYLCKINSTDEVQYLVRNTASSCSNHKQKNKQQEKKDE